MSCLNPIAPIIPKRVDPCTPYPCRPLTRHAYGVARRKPPPDEIIIALAGAVGTELAQASLELKLALEPYGIETRELSLSEMLKSLPQNHDLPGSPYDERVWSFMDAGNKLREDWERGDALGLLAVREIQATRSPKARVAYVLRSVKHPAEVETLRSIYGSRFFLVSAYRPRTVRLAAVRGLLADSTRSSDPEDWTYLPEHILDRDEFEGPEYGQQLREVFPLADYFIDATNRERMRPELNRFTELIFGAPFRTPTRAEYALACAESAALRSAELGRQVGACLSSPSGEIIALGTNEVPKAAGGVYWEGDENDAREFHLEIDTNDANKREIADDIAQGLEERLMLNLDPDTRPEPAEVLEVILRSRLGALTEFGRAVHAEMGALLDAARRGVSVQGATLYSTTFPCHNCARHLITAGVSEVVYVAPYAKSQAFRMHSDSIVVAEANPPKDKLHLRPFVGAAPRLYARVFSAGKRKEKTGEPIKFERSIAQVAESPEISPELVPKSPIYLAREKRAIKILEGLLADAEDVDGPGEMSDS